MSAPAPGSSLAASASVSSPAPSVKASARPYIGGQAVLEGVMMRAPNSFAVVVRQRDGSLVVRERGMSSESVGVRRFPFVRGLTSMVESLRLGGEALRFSAERLETDVAVTPAAAAASSIARGLVAWSLTLLQLVTTADGEQVPAARVDADAKKGGRGPMGLMMIVAVLFMFALPQGAAAGVNRLLHLGLELQSPAFQALTGVFKLTIVVGYLLLIRRVPDIRRVFQYHGAEHKTISTYEAGDPLLVPYARPKTTLHPRCGTTFLVMVALVSIAVFTAVGGLLPRIHTGNALFDNVIFFFEKLPFVPVIASVTFELQRLFARYCTRGVLRALLVPGFAVQKITTIEPDDDQLEVALASLRVTLSREALRATTAGAPAGEPDADLCFPNYEALVAVA